MTKTAAKKVVAVKKKDVLDPRKADFLTGYIDPKSPTYCNAFQSAIAAGYSKEYAQNITHLMPDWLSERIGQERRIRLAEKHLDEVLELPIEVQAMGAFGPIIDKESKQPVMVKSMEVVKQKTKVTEFVLERLDKKNYGKDNSVKIGFNFNITDAKSRYEA